MITNQPHKMAVKPILPLLLAMSFPAMLSMFIQSMYNIVDSMFIAQYSTDALTAVSLAFPIQNLILAVAVGTGIGINTVVARKLGEQNFAQADQAATHGFILAILSSCLFMVFGSLLVKPFFALFTDSPTILALGSDYTLIITLCSFGIIIHIAIEKILQATGKMIFPMLFQATGAIINIILDPILIFGLLGFPAMGIKGAAIATVIGQLAAMLCALLTLFFVKTDVNVKFKNFRFDFKVIKDIYAIGIPATLIYSLGSLLVMGVNTILIAFSEAAVALFGIFFKLQSFVLMPILGLTQGAMPIFGYNYGAKNVTRIRETLKWSILISGGIAAFGTILFSFFPSFLLAFFGADGEMQQIGITALPILSVSFVPAAIALIFSTLFQAVKRGGFSLIIAVIRQGIVILPLAIILAPFFGLTGIWSTFIIAEVAATVIALILYRSVLKKDPVFQHEQN